MQATPASQMLSCTTHPPVCLHIGSGGGGGGADSLFMHIYNPKGHRQPLTSRGRPPKTPDTASFIAEVTIGLALVKKD